MSFQPKLKKPPTFDRQKSHKLPLSRTVTVFLDDVAVEGLTKAHESLAKAEARSEALRKVLTQLEADGTPPETGRVVESEAATTAAADDVSRAEASVQEAYDDLMENHAASFELVSIGRKRYDRLVHEHPATGEQNAQNQKEFGSDAPYNADTFPPDLLQQVCVSPVMELWEWKAMLDWDLLTDEELSSALEALELEQATGLTRDATIATLRDAQPEWNTSELVELISTAIEVCTHRRVVSLGKVYG